MQAEHHRWVNGPLNGIRILDLTHVWAGPLAVRMLADLGAEVIKIEAPYGRGPQQMPAEPIGGWLGGQPGEEPWNDNAMFAKFHRNRRSVCVNLKQASGRQLLLELAAEADVIVENFSAGAMQKMQLGYAVLKAANPAIIYVTMPGFGASGPYCQRVAFGPVVEPMSGLTVMLGYAPEEPRNSAMAVMDPVAATHAFAGVVTALRNRARDGEGCCVELSLHEGGVSYSGPWLLERQMGEVPRCVGNRHPNMAPHGIYRCRGEDQWIALACESDAQWAALCDVIKAADQGAALEPGWSLQQRRDHADGIDHAIGEWCRAKDKHRLAETLQRRGVPAGPVNTVAEMAGDPHVQERGFFVPYERFATPMPGNPIHMSGLDSREWTPCPRLGQHNREVLAEWLGMGDEQIDDLVKTHVIADQPPD